MSIRGLKFKDRKGLNGPSNSNFGGAPDGGQPRLRPGAVPIDTTATEPQNLVNPGFGFQKQIDDVGFSSLERCSAKPSEREVNAGSPSVASTIVQTTVPSASAEVESAVKSTKEEKVAEKDFALLARDRWLVRNGHLITYVGLYLFSVLVLFRPYEILPGMGFLAFTAFYVGAATMLIFFPSQLATEGNLTMLSTEVKAVLALAAIALLTVPIAKDPGLAWEIFNDPFIKAVAIFVVLVNVVRTRKRLMSMMWLSFGIGIYLSVCAVQLYMEGKFAVEQYRVQVSNINGIFGNPNEMALHFVMMTPITLALGIASRYKVMKVVYFAATGLFIAANMVTYSRGGFLGLLGVAAVLAWKLGRRHKVHTVIGSLLIGGVTILAAPGNYGLRMISIFIPSLDPVGSSDARRELLERSLLVTARNPWGIGIGNFEIVGIQNHQTHNAYTQVSSELGILGLVAYLAFMISPFRKLRAIERRLFETDDLNWFYYVSIGLQASIVGYWVSSFFASVAYNWFIYYLLAYAVAFRRIYSLEKEATEGTVEKTAPSLSEPQTA
ncbi:MAG TPA: O-antigen ligase family protein [Pyrinomonadaceae bacterium]|jgi:O-antigen ligase|nr:O-antigen ligase family protein [Pyrinomonadaceae bacterium]